VLAGQAWSNFMDKDTYADTVDFFGPVGVEFIRQAQNRYSTGLAEGLSLDLEAENSEFLTRTLNTAATALAANAGIVDIMPDFIAALRQRDSWGAINVAGIGRHFNTDLGASGDVVDSAGWGFHAGTTIKLPFIAEGDKIGRIFNAGQGLGRYLTGGPGSGTVMVHCNNLGSSTQNLSGASPLTNPGCNPTMSVATSWGGVVGGTHKWTSNLYSNAYYGHTSNDYDVNAVGARMVRVLTKSTDSSDANILWTPVAAVTVGFEYMHGWIDTVSQTAGTEGSGTASCFQLSMNYGL